MRARAGVLCVGLVAFFAALAVPDRSSEAVPGDQAIAFASDRDTADESHEIYRMAPDGSGLRRLTTNAERDTAPSWSPDGASIVFVRHSTDHSDSRIMVMEADGSNVRDVSTEGHSCPPEFSPCGRWLDGDPSWSPDGRRIVFARHYRSGNIYVMDADGTDQQRLTAGPNGETSPDWSPDGRRIVFSSHRDNQHLDIFTMDPDGTDVTRLTHTGPSYERDPAWSPDGKTIAFISDRHAPVADVNDVYVMNVEGTNVRRLTKHPADDSQPAWSPDGTKIVFESNRFGNYELFSMNADGTGVARLTTNAAFDGWAEWGIESSGPSPTQSGEPPSPEPSYSSPPEYAITTTLRLRDSLRAVGAVRAQERFAPCEAGRYTEIQRRRAGEWLTVETTRTDASGRYSVDIADRAGRYRTFVPHVYTEDYHCYGDASPRRVYRK